MKRKTVYRHRRYGISGTVNKSGIQKHHVILQPYIHSDVSRDEIAISAQFKRSMKLDNQKRKELMAPIAKYDVVRKLAYLEYPDGRIIYADKT